uniref:Uncharacterized protein n=1 Tax=Anopheles culicifacies TaxID=139723 RepID=A0A182MKZ3_9DIPT
MDIASVVIMHIVVILVMRRSVVLFVVMVMHYIMLYIVVRTVCTLVLLTAAVVGAAVLPVVQHHHDDHGPAEYHFEYSVHDAHTGDIKQQHEERHGDKVTGQYSLIDPDGYRRVVDYTADKHTGFVANVHREPIKGVHVVESHKKVAIVPVVKLVKSIVLAPADHHIEPVNHCVLSDNVVTVTFFTLALDITGMVIVDGVFELVFGRSVRVFDMLDGYRKHCRAGSGHQSEQHAVLANVKRMIQLILALE